MPRGNKCRKVAVARDVNVPAMCELDIEVYAILPNLLKEDKQWATRPQLLESGLVVAGTLLPDRTDELLMRVLNPTAQSLSLKRGNQWPVEEVQVLERPLEAEFECPMASVRQISEESENAEEESVLAPLWTEIADDVPVEMAEKLRRIVLDNRQAFSLHDWDLGYTELLQHEIDTGTEMPVRQSLRRQPLVMLPVIDAQVGQMLEQHLI